MRFISIALSTGGGYPLFLKQFPSPLILLIARIADLEPVVVVDAKAPLGRFYVPA
jgi:hypothetical protein